MTFKEYVESGKQAKAAEEQAGWKLAELAAGVENEYGKLADWAREVGISDSRARGLRTAFVVRSETFRADDLTISAARELAPMPVAKREKFLVENPRPTQRSACEAAELYRKKRELKPEPLSTMRERHHFVIWTMVADLNTLVDDYVLGVPMNQKARDYTLRGIAKLIELAESYATSLVETDLAAL